MERDVHCLAALFAGEEPAERTVRAAGTVLAAYLVGDASGDGFGSIILEGGRVEYQAAGWGVRYKQETSNWREANNLTTRAERMGKEGRLQDKELFIVTDNSVFEGTYYKGHSKSPRLNDIIFRLHKLERETGALFHVVHVAGKRMMDSGVDNLSRRDFMQGIMAGKDPLSYFPFHLDANQRTGGKVAQWVNSWWTVDGRRKGWFTGKPLKLLTHEDWFTLYENDRPRLWCPPPAAMSTVLELFTDDRMVHPGIPHVFCVPRLMTHLWRKALRKDADLEFRVEEGVTFWPKGMYEPLIVLVVLPLHFVPHHRGPWVVHGTERAVDYQSRLDALYGRPKRNGQEGLHDVGGSLHDLRGDGEAVARDLLRKFLAEA